MDRGLHREQSEKMFHSEDISCPYCGEIQTTDLDGTGGSQEYWQDCQVCCAPILFRLTVNPWNGELTVTVHRDDE